MTSPNARGSVIQGHFPRGLPRHLQTPAQPAQAAAPDANRRMPPRPAPLPRAAHIQPTTQAAHPAPRQPATSQRHAAPTHQAAQPTRAAGAARPGPAASALQPFRAQPRAGANAAGRREGAGEGAAVRLPPHLTNFGGRGGRLLPPTVQLKMESLFGTNFADVRVHVGPQAATIGALAFTHGSDIYFAPGHYDPLSRRGLRILGHELTHVVQQREGRARNPFGAGVAVVQNQALEAEAERMGSRAAAVPLPHERGRGPATVQRMTAGGADSLTASAGRPGARSAGIGGRPLRGSPLLSARRVIQPIFEEDLRAVSLATRAFGYSKGAEEIQELQSMYLDGSVVVTSNYPGDLAQVEAALFPGKRQARAVNMSETLTEMITSASLDQPKRRYSYFALEQIGSDDLFEGVKKTNLKIAKDAEALVRDRLIAKFATSAFANITTVVPCKSSTACAEALDKPHQLIILQGASTSEKKVHAEQLLLEVLARRLKAGKVPTQLGIHGTKFACTKCQTALSCFSFAYREVYGRELGYTTGGRGSDADILNLGEIFPGESPTTRFGQFVLLYSELRSPTKYTLSDVGGVAAAKDAINNTLTTHKKTRAWGWLEHALSEGKTDLKFRLSTIADEPIILISSKDTGENYLSRLIESNETLHSRTIYTLSDPDGVTRAKAAINALPMNKKFRAWSWLEERKDKITDLRFRLSDIRDEPILPISSSNAGVDYLSALLASNESRL